MIARDTNIRQALRDKQRGFLLNPFRFGGGGGGGGSINFTHNWATVAPFIVDPTNPATYAYTSPNVGSATVSGGRLVVSSYGTGASWHGPSIYHNVGTFADFQFDFNVTYSSSNVNQLFQLAVCLHSAANPNADRLFFGVTDFSSSTPDKQRFFIEGGTTRVNTTDTTNRTAVAVQVKRQAGVTSFSFNGSVAYSGASSITANLDTIAIQMTQYTTFTPYTVSVGSITLASL